MGNEVIALENEANPFVAVAIPFGIAEMFGALAIDQKIAGGVVIEPPMMLSNVVLPQPEGPKIATKPRLGKASEISLESRKGFPVNVIVFFDMAKNEARPFEFVVQV
jgi:hypothetical protein